jgi:hypothetical protein
MMKNPFDTGIRMTVVRDPTRTTCSVDEFVLCPTNARADAAIQRAERAEHARDEAVLEAIWRIENETRAAGERDKARAEVARLRPVVEAARAWGAVQCECATGELEPTATALANALFALGTP